MAGLAWQQDVVVILPTGSGKSAIVATIAKLEKLKITAVLCPLRSLLSDWKRRLERLNVPFEVFNTSKPFISGQAPIVLVSLDATDRLVWRQAVNSLRPEITLNRYVIDEAHLVLTEAGYRDIMHHVKELRDVKAQLMLLSATIPPSTIDRLRSEFNLASGTHTRIIRAPSNRPELLFHAPVLISALNAQVSWTTDSAYNRYLYIIQEIERVCTSILDSVAQLSTEERILVFVQKLVNGHTLSKQLACEFYRGSTDTHLTNTERDAIAERWFQGTHKLMVATDAFGPGNDYPHVRHVWFVGSPKGLVDMLQMAGRGGRDRKMANIHFFHIASEGFPAQPSDKLVGRPELQLLMKKPILRCWREVCGRFIDGVAHKCTSSSYDWRCPACASSLPVRPPAWLKVNQVGKAQPCIPVIPPAPLLPSDPILSPQVGAVRPRAPSTSLALPSSIGSIIGSGTAFLEPQRNAKRLKNSRDAEFQPHVDRVNRAIAVLSGHCAFCRVYQGGAPVPKHPGGIVRCPSILSLLRDTNDATFRRGGQYLDWKRSLHYDANSGVCFTCHLPFMHDQLHQPKQGKKNVCNPQHEDMVVPVVYWAFMDESMRLKLQQKFHQTWESDVEYREWLGHKVKGKMFTNIMEVFLWVVETKFAGAYVV
ncbi:P-loop containing nucleoside triphosphate hydrolase protein [Cubamyces sp. BRFM 1775]|nr:P-loop containing nucleoside triphosphate hydrolase protein [Cubamyces sp. BRFM 1775]